MFCIFNMRIVETRGQAMATGGGRLERGQAGSHRLQVTMFCPESTALGVLLQREM